MQTSCWKKAEILGVFVSFGSAVLLHGLYEQSNRALWAGILGAANESLWEHGKILVLPYLLWAVGEALCCRPSLRSWLTAKAAGAVFLLAASFGFFGLYTLFSPPILWLDIFSAFLWTALAFRISYRLELRQSFSAWAPAAALVWLLLGIMLLTFTLRPPQGALFTDPQTGLRGLDAVRQTMIPL